MLLQLRGELSSFVCKGQYGDGMVRILDSFLRGRSQPSQKAAWVSGFYGSGKSHLLKMLCHLWRDTVFSDGATARSLVPDLPDDVRGTLSVNSISRDGNPVASSPPPASCPPGHLRSVRQSVLASCYAQSNSRSSTLWHNFNSGWRSRTFSRP